MDKLDKIMELIAKIKDEAGQLEAIDETEHMSAEEIVVMATETVTNQPVMTIKYTSPVGVIDRARVTFHMVDYMGEVYDFPLFGEEHYGED